MSEMRTKDPKDIWGAGERLTLQWENELFEAAMAAELLDEKPFRPDEFVKNCGGLDHFGKAMTEVIAFVLVGGKKETHEQFCKRVEIKLGSVHVCLCESTRSTSEIKR